MAIYKTFIRQIAFDGVSYTKGTTVDLLSKFNIVAQEFPFVKFPKPKDLPTRDWAGSDGLDVYIPSGALPAKSYDIEVTFLYKGTGGDGPNSTIRADITNFINFLYGRAKGGNSDVVQSARLAIYDQHTGIGRKDVVVSEIDNELFYCSNLDNDTVAKFKVKFTVHDPVTDVTPTYNNNGNIRYIDWNA